MKRGLMIIATLICLSFGSSYSYAESNIRSADFSQYSLHTGIPFTSNFVSIPWVSSGVASTMDDAKGVRAKSQSLFSSIIAIVILSTLF